MVSPGDKLWKVPNILDREFAKKLKPVLLPWLADCLGRPGPAYKLLFVVLMVWPFSLAEC